MEAIPRLVGTPRDIKTRFKFLHRGLWTQHKIAQVALQRFQLVSTRCILCNYAVGTHLHIITCVATDRLFEWLEDFGDLMNVSFRMTTEDKVYGTVNGGEKMQKGMLFFYGVLFKHLWIGYTSCNKEGIAFSETKVWHASIRRLKIVLHGFEVETVKRFEQIERLMHSHAGFTAEQRTKVRDRETERRNAKLAPLGSFTVDSEGIHLERNFRWKDLARITENEE